MCLFNLEQARVFDNNKMIFFSARGVSGMLVRPCPYRLSTFSLLSSTSLELLLKCVATLQGARVQLRTPTAAQWFQ